MSTVLTLCLILRIFSRKGASPYRSKHVVNENPVFNSAWSSNTYCAKMVRFRLHSWIASTKFDFSPIFPVQRSQRTHPTQDRRPFMVICLSERRRFGKMIRNYLPFILRIMKSLSWRLLGNHYIPWICYERSFSEFYLSIWNQLVFQSKASVVCSVTAVVFIDFCLKKCVFPTYW